MSKPDSAAAKTSAKKSKSKKWRGGWRRGLLFSLVLIVVFCVLFVASWPWTLRWAAEYALLNLGAKKAHIETLSFQPWRGSLEIQGLELELETEQQPSLQLERLNLQFSLKALLQSSLLLKSLELEKVRLLVRLEPTAPLQQLHLDKLQLGKLDLSQPDAAVPLHLQGKINQAPLQLSGHFKPLAKQPSASLAVDLQPLDLTPFLSLVELPLAELQGQLSIHSQLEVHLEAEQPDLQLPDSQQQDFQQLDFKKLNVEQTGAWQLENLSAQQEANNAQLGSLSWQGKTQLELDLTNLTFGALFTGALKAQYLNAAAAKLEVAASLEEANWQGALNLSSLEKPQLQLEHLGQAQLKNAQLLDVHLGQEILSFSQLAATEVQIRNLEQISLAQLQLDAGQAFSSPSLHFNQASNQKNQPSLQLEQLNLQQIQLQNLQHLAIELAEIKQPSGWLRLSPTGELEVIPAWLKNLETRWHRLAALEKTSPEAPAAEKVEKEKVEEEKVSDKAEEKTEFSWHLDQLKIHSSKPFYILDTSLEPRVLHSFTLKNIDLNSLDSRQILQPTAVQAQLGLYDYGQLTAAGSFTPLAELSKLQAELELNLEALDLVRLSPYIEKLLGYRVQTGQLNAASQVKIRQGQLQSNTKLQAQRLKMQPADAKVIARINKQLTMPISTVLTAITDKKGTLNLDIPVQGDLNSPDIGLGSIMRTAATQALRNGAVTYFKVAVQPFGALAFAAEKIGDMNLQAKFSDAFFEPNSTELIAEQQGYLAKVAQLLAEKPNLDLITCVYVTEQDFLARAEPVQPKATDKLEWDELAKQLALERQAAIHAELIEQEGVNPKQVQACQPQLGKGRPRVVLGI